MSQTSTLQINISTSTAGTFSFDYKVSTAPGNSYTITLDGNEIANVSNESGWLSKAGQLSVGNHNLILQYHKQGGSVSMGDDCAFFTNLRLDYDKIASGEFASGARWLLSTLGTLYIYGNGAIDNYTSASSTPWYTYRNNVTNISIGSSITSIGNYSFASCNLENIEIPSSVTNIGNYAFSGCSALTHANMENVQTIGIGAFTNCSLLASLELGNSVTTIGNNALSNCSSIASLSLPQTLTSISISAFEGCSALKNINVDKDNTVYCSLDGTLYSKDLTKLIKYPIAKTGDSYIVPKGVLTIEDKAFANNNNISSIVLPETITSIGGSAFTGGSNFSSLTIIAKTPPTISSSSIKTGTTIHVLSDWVNLYKSTNIWKNYTINGDGVDEYVEIGEIFQVVGLQYKVTSNLPPYACEVYKTMSTTTTTYTIPKTATYRNRDYNVVGIGEGAFKNRTNVSRVDVQSSGTITYIGNDAFNGCVCLATTQFLEGLVSIGKNAFKDCKLTTVSLPSTVKTIGASAFEGNQMTSIKIPEGVTRIENSTFYNCTKLQTVNLPNTLTSIGSSAFNGCTSLLAVNNVHATTIGLRAFYNCLKLSTLSLKKPIEEIGIYAFYNCKALTALDNLSALTSLGQYAFSDCSGLKSITLDGTFTTLDLYVFQNCTGLTNFVIPNHVTSIGQWAFSGCSNLQTLSIPASLTTIGAGAFNGCNSLYAYNVDDTNQHFSSSDGVLFNKQQSVLVNYPHGKTDSEYIIPDGVTTISSQAFKCNNLCSITLPATLTTIGSNAIFGTSLTSIKNLALAPQSMSSGSIKSSVTIHVLSAVLSAFQTDDVWKTYTIVGDADPKTITLTDGQIYSQDSDEEYDEINYTRKLSNAGKWQALYVPFSISVEDYKDDFDIAEIFAFSPFVDTNGNGELDGNDDCYLFVTFVKTGTTTPNMPYVIRPKRADSFVINSSDGLLHAAANGRIVLATSKQVITITGVYEPYPISAGDNNYYLSAKGNISYTSSTSNVIPNRWVMHKENIGYGGSVSNLNEVKEYGILAIGEDLDQETAIKIIQSQNDNSNQDNLIYTLDGRLVNPTTVLPAGIYIKNGKKYIVK